MQTLDKHAPKKQKVLRAKNKPYMNKDLSKAIKSRSRLKNIANKTKKETDINKYKSQRNRVVKMNRKLKRDFYKSVDPKKINTDTKFWKMVKPMVSNVNPMEQKIILIEGEEILAKDEEVAECLNTYFVNITDSLNLNASDNESNVEDSLDSRIDTAIVRYANHQSILAIKEVAKNVTKFDFEHVNPWNVMEKIESFDCNKSVSGNIPTNVLKQAKEVACPYVTDCINNSINDGIFPTELKMADVTSFFKSGEKTTKKNFRPISILPCVSKVYERLLGDQLNEHFTSRNDILCNLLSGFRKGYSTQHALQIVIENWKRSLDSKGIVGTILMDLSKAYDCLPHDLLIAKLEAYGIERKSLKLIYSYLSGRKQRVKVASHYSSYKKIKIGVPQGSVLGPLLFNIFINDLFLINLQSDLCNFADDNTLYACGHSFESVVSKLENDLEKILG